MDLIYLTEHGPTQDEFEFLDSMQQYPPRTDFSPGNLALLKEVPPKVRWSMEWIPRIWQVRFVVSAYQFEMHQLLHTYPHIGFDQAHVMLEQGPLEEQYYRNPLVYAHAFPHGAYPNSCHWFPERVLKRMVIKSPNGEWPHVLDEFKTPFVGYDPGDFGASFVLDMAPDRYSDGQQLDRPLSMEEESFHSACLLGLEEYMVHPVQSPVIPVSYQRFDVPGNPFED